MRIRPARLADAAPLARVHVDTWRIAYPGIVPAEVLDSLSYRASTETWLARLSASKEGVYAYVAETEADKLVGFALGGPERDGYTAYEGELYAIYVHPAYHGRGVGRHLAQAIARQLAGAGMRSMLVWVLEKNPARAFYEALGGQLLYRREIPIGGVALPEVAYGWEDICRLYPDT